MQICHRQWLVVVSQQGLRDSEKMSRQFHEHSESSLQSSPEDIAAYQGYLRLLFVPWKVFQDEETATSCRLQYGSAVYTIKMKWAAKFYRHVDSFLQVSHKAFLGVSRL
jgi:hypothetical protein